MLYTLIIIIFRNWACLSTSESESRRIINLHGFDAVIPVYKLRKALEGVHSTCD